MIQTGFYHIPAKDEAPEIFGELRSAAPCGCTVVVGRRTDLDEVALAGLRCCGPHLPLIDSFMKLLIDSLDDPTDRLLIDVVDEFLQQAYEEFVSSVAGSIDRSES